MDWPESTRVYPSAECRLALEMEPLLPLVRARMGGLGGKSLTTCGGGWTGAGEPRVRWVGGVVRWGCVAEIQGGRKGRSRGEYEDDMVEMAALRAHTSNGRFCEAEERGGSMWRGCSGTKSSE
jgi:hypothetical protein